MGRSNLDAYQCFSCERSFANLHSCQVPYQPDCYFCNPSLCSPDRVESGLPQIGMTTNEICHLAANDHPPTFGGCQNKMST